MFSSRLSWVILLGFTLPSIMLAASASPFADPGSVANNNDLDRNGVPDLIWQRDSDRVPVVWYMGGADGSVPQTSQPTCGLVFPGWTIVGIADLDLDAKPDFIWQNDTDGTPMVWYMGGAVGCTPLRGKPIGGPVPGWRIVGVADLDRNQRPDLIWQNDTDRTPVVWYMGGDDGSTPQTSRAMSGPVPGWRIVGVVDLNGNGRPDLIWQNDTDRTPVVWFMGGIDGGTPQTSKPISGPVSGWTIVAAADLDRNGKTDLIWQNDIDRTPVVWFMGGTDGSTPQSGKNISGPVPGWRIVGP